MDFLRRVWAAHCNRIRENPAYAAALAAGAAAVVSQDTPLDLLAALAAMLLALHAATRADPYPSDPYPSE